jgi:ubiquinone biosynthesis protein UbiJ
MFEQPVFAAINHVLAQSAWATARLAPFAGRVVRVSMPPFRLRFSISPQGFLARATTDEGFDVDVSLPADAPLRLAHGYDQLMAAARISGAADFADTLSFVFSRLRWDAEEDLARFVGDIAAHRLSGLAGSFIAWQRSALANLGDNVGEYLTHEQPLLAQRQQIGTLSEGVAGLAAAVARLEMRLAQQR